MTFKWVQKKRFPLLFIILFIFVSLLYLKSILAIPGEIVLLDDVGHDYSFRSPFLVNIKLDRDGIIKLNKDDLKVSSNSLKLSSPISMRAQSNGSVSLSLRFLGLIPLKTMRVDVVPNRELVACGNTVGVKLKIDGILVIGISDVEGMDGKRTLPVAEANIKPGDLIMQVNGKKLDSIDDLIKEIDKSNGSKIKLRYKSGSILKDVEIVPVKAVDDKKYHIGLWVRDSTAGIGTLTFYDPGTGCFGALGHGITDIDTGTLMPIENGEILESNILGVKRGRQGMPGELKGVFIEDKNKLGIIQVNSNYGIYGKLNPDATQRIARRQYPIGLRNQVKEGPAVILSNINGKDVEAYDVEIQKVSRQNLNGSKGMIIRIVDKRLLDATGGIVQGMSGSPIIQDNRIIGAVTHVLVNDPARGYGILIEGMIRNLPEGNRVDVEKAG